MKKHTFNKKHFVSFIPLLLILVFTIKGTALATSIPGKNVTQNWAASAVFYDSPCAETETFHMSEKDFLAYKLDLESRLVFAYSAYYNNLASNEQKALEQAQKDWITCYYAYEEALKQRWIQPVKIYFGVTGKERRTNIYREFLILFLTNRITDLEEWNRGQLATVETAFSIDKANQYNTLKNQLQVDMGLCLYVIQEEYREKIKTAHQTFFTFLESNQNFISLISNDDIAIVSSEGLLQIERMSYLTSVHYQGCRFFRREREE